MRTRVHFRSNKFPANAGEEEQVNPGLWGERLAQYLYEQLERRGFEVDDIFPEDWGWGVRLVPKSFLIWIGCGHREDSPDAFFCFIQPSKPWIRKFLFRKVHTSAEVSPVVDAIDQILREDPDVREVHWLTEAEQ